MCIYIMEQRHVDLAWLLEAEKNIEYVYVFICYNNDYI